MKLKLLLILCAVFLINSCISTNDTDVNTVGITVNFTHSWGDTPVTNADFNSINFTNANGELLSIERLRYLISEIVLTHENGAVSVLNGYNLVDVTNNTNLSFTTSPIITPGNYTNVSFRFGFRDSNNINGAYLDLNTVNFNVPGMLGGGYHYMQLDGKYLDNTTEAPFNYHVIRAVNTTDPNNLLFQDTSFIVNLGAITIGDSTGLTIEMDIAEWFQNPNTWDLNLLNTVLMPNFNAQLMMNANGASVFSLVNVTQ
ncbi:MAG: hypothetical protein JKY02_10520 [Flavobacteriaceae bacterium]|nr:hypothetical protein [Flavobacteriaceae bacterium]